MSEIARKLDDLGEIQTTHKIRYFRVMDELMAAMKGWSEAIYKWAPYLPVEFRTDTRDLFDRTHDLLGELRECHTDHADDIAKLIELMHDTIGQMKERKSK